MSSGATQLLLSTKYPLQAIGVGFGSNMWYVNVAVRRLFVNYVVPWLSQTESDEDVDSYRFGDTPQAILLIPCVVSFFILYPDYVAFLY